MADKDKVISRDDLLADFRKEFGAENMFLMGQSSLMDIKVRSSGSIFLDLALGGGYPHGRILEFRGKEKSGKTTLASLAIAEAQRVEPEKENAIIDLENSYNPKWAETLGVDTDKLFISQPEANAETVYAMIEHLLSTGRFAYIVLDSVAGLVTKGEYEQKDWEKEGRVGGASKLNSQAMRKLVNSGLLTKSGTTLIFINQLRDKIGGFSMYGTPTDTTGGRALKHAYSQTLDVSTGDFFSKGTGFTGKKVFGQQARVKVSKNKIAPPFKTATLDLYYDQGVDKIMELAQVAKEIGVLNGTSWLTFIDVNTGEIIHDEATDKPMKWNGLNKTVEALKDDIENNGGAIYTRMFEIVQDAIRG